MLVGALLLFQGQQGKTEFRQGVEAFDASIRDTINDVGSGQYAGQNSAGGYVTCTAGGGTLTIGSTGTDRQGENTDCMFIGKVLQPGLGNCQTIGVSTVAGARLASGKEVSSFAEARPAVATSFTRPTDFGLCITRVYDGGTHAPINAAAGFFTTFGQYGATSDLLSGAQTVNLAIVPTGPVGASQSAVNTGVTNLASGSGPTLNPPGGIVICMKDGNGSSTRQAAVRIGGDSGKLHTSVYYDKSYILSQLGVDCP